MSRSSHRPDYFESEPDSLHILVDYDVKDQVVALSRALGVSEGAIVRRLLEAGLNNIRQGVWKELKERYS